MGRNFGVAASRWLGCCVWSNRIRRSSPVPNWEARVQGLQQAWRREMIIRKYNKLIKYFSECLRNYITVCLKFWDF